MLIYQKMVWLKIARLSTSFKSLSVTILYCGAKQSNHPYTSPALVYLHLSSICGLVKSVRSVANINFYTLFADMHLFHCSSTNLDFPFASEAIMFYVTNSLALCYCEFILGLNLLFECISQILLQSIDVVLPYQQAA